MPHDDLLEASSLLQSLLLDVAVGQYENVKY